MILLSGTYFIFCGSWYYLGRVFFPTLYRHFSHRPPPFLAPHFWRRPNCRTLHLTLKAVHRSNRTEFLHRSNRTQMKLLFRSHRSNRKEFLHRSNRTQMKLLFWSHCSNRTEFLRRSNRTELLHLSNRTQIKLLFWLHRSNRMN